MNALRRVLPDVVALALWGLCPLYLAWRGLSSPHDFGRVAQFPLLVAGAFLLAARLWHAKSRPRVMTPAWMAAIATGLLVAGSTADAAFPLVALREVVLMLGLAALTLALAEAFDRHGIDRFLRIAALGGAIYALIYLGLLGLMLQQGAKVYTWDLAFGFDNPRFLNHCQTIAFPLAAIVMVDDRQPRWVRLSAAFGLFIGGGILALLLGRATMLALAAGVAVLVLRRSTRRAGLWLAALLVAGGALAWSVGHGWGQTPGYDVNTRELTISHSRNDLLEASLEQIERAPVLGVGPMHFAHWYRGKVAHPHNLYLQWAAEYGLPATALVLALIAGGLWRFVRRTGASAAVRPEVAGGVLAALVGLLVDAAFSGNAVMPLSQLWIVVAVALALHLYRRAATAPPSVSPSVVRPAAHPAAPVTSTAASTTIMRALAVLLLGAVGTLTAVSMREAAMPEPVIVVKSANPPIEDGRYRPRHWAHGTF